VIFRCKTVLLPVFIIHVFAGKLMLYLETDFARCVGCQETICYGITLEQTLDRFPGEGTVTPVYRFRHPVLIQPINFIFRHKIPHFFRDVFRKNINKPAGDWNKL